MEATAELVLGGGAAASIGAGRGAIGELSDLDIALSSCCWGISMIGRLRAKLVSAATEVIRWVRSAGAVTLFDRLVAAGSKPAPGRLARLLEALLRSALLMVRRNLIRMGRNVSLDPRKQRCHR